MPGTKMMRGKKAAKPSEGRATAKKMMRGDKAKKNGKVKMMRGGKVKA